MEKRPHLQQMVLGNVDMQMQKDEIRHIPITLHCDAVLEILLEEIIDSTLSMCREEFSEQTPLLTN